MGNISEVKRQWLEELSALTGGATAPAEIAPGLAMADTSPDAEMRSALLGDDADDAGINPFKDQSVQLADSAPGTAKLTAGGKPGAPRPAPAGKSPAKPAKVNISLEVTSVEPVKETLPKQAKAIRLGDGRTQFDFGLAITKEQAAQLLFVDGKVPSGAKLVPGPGKNSWTVVTPDLETQAAVAKKMKARTESVDTGKPGEFTITWNDDPGKAGKEPERKDLKNNLGFWISKKYELDIGQLDEKQTRKRLGRGDTPHGYQIVFEKPVTKDQVMDKIFVRKKVPEGDVVLVALPSEPTTLWEVQVIGAGAATAFTREASQVFGAATLYAEKSIPPGVPDSIRAHIENKTVPKDAKKHPPNIYVWEADKYIARVVTDGKGKNGSYTYETTKLHPSDEQGNATMRYFMIEQGMPVKQAWEEYVKHWDEIHIAQLGIVATLGGMGVPRLPGARPPLPSAKGRGGSKPPIPPVEPGAGGARGGDTLVSHPPPMPKPEINPKAPVAAPRTKGPEPTTNQGLAPTDPALPQRPPQGHPLDSTAPGSPPKPPATPSKQAMEPPKPPSAPSKQEGSRPKQSTSPPNKPGKGETIDDPSGAPIPPPPGGEDYPPHVPGEILRPGKFPKEYEMRPYPADAVIKIRTSKGVRELTVGQYRKDVADAKKWLSEEADRLNLRSRAGPGTELIKKAQDKHGLDKYWNSPGNPYIYGREPRQRDFK